MPLLAAVLALLMLTAACGGDDDETVADDSSTTTTTTTTPPASGGADGDTETGSSDGGDDAEDGSADSDDDAGSDDAGSDDAEDGSADGGDGDGEDEGPGPTTTTTYELADQAFTEDSAVSTVGLDEITFGMTPDEAAAAARTTWEGLPDPPYPDCVAITPSNGPTGVTFYVIRNTVERVDITNPDIRTRSDYGVGTTLEELRAGLGDSLKETSDGEDGVTATFVPTDESDAAFRIVFEVELGEVVSFRSGRALYIEFAPGECDEYDPPPLPDPEEEEEEPEE